MVYFSCIKRPFQRQFYKAKLAPFMKLLGFIFLERAQGYYSGPDPEYLSSGGGGGGHPRFFFKERASHASEKICEEKK